jgi:hypothetical protein
MLPAYPRDMLLDRQLAGASADLSSSGSSINFIDVSLVRTRLQLTDGCRRGQALPSNLLLGDLTRILDTRILIAEPESVLGFPAKKSRVLRIPGRNLRGVARRTI